MQFGYLISSSSTASQAVDGNFSKSAGFLISQRLASNLERVSDTLMEEVSSYIGLENSGSESV